MYVITGGGSGIGRALAHSLSDREKQVLIVGRQQEMLDETAHYSPLIRTCCADVSQEDGRQKVVECLSNVPVVSGLVHNAGLIAPLEAIDKIVEQDWQQLMNTNVNAPLFLTQKLLNKLQNGRVLHLGSAVAYFPVQGWAPYCVSKAALSMLTRCWQLECHAPVFTSVMPGIIDTAMQESIRQTSAMTTETQQFYQTLKLENRLITPAASALFLRYLLLDVSASEYSSQEWDIYKTEHHHFWLTAPHQIPSWE